MKICAGNRLPPIVKLKQNGLNSSDNLFAPNFFIKRQLNPKIKQRNAAVSETRKCLI